MITRSAGITVRGWAGPLPGGGYEGKTRALDCAVSKQAHWLENYFNRPVEIRFNSHRESGGAWIVDPSHENAGIGLNVGLRYTRNLVATNRLVYSVYIAVDLLQAPKNIGSGQFGRYGYFFAKSQADARNILLRKLAEWRKKP